MTTAAPTPEIRRFAPANLRAALWALRALRQVRYDVGHGGIDTPPPPPPADTLPAAAERGVRAVLHRWHATCLEAALVLQSWRAAHDDRRDLVVGVTAPGLGDPAAQQFRAHAWLDGDEPCHDGEFTELVRRPAGAAAGSTSAVG